MMKRIYDCPVAYIMLQEQDDILTVAGSGILDFDGASGGVSENDFPIIWRGRE